MIDIKFLRENPEVVKENIRKKFQDEKLSLVDEVIALDAESRKAKQEADDLRASRNRIILSTFEARLRHLIYLHDELKRENAELKQLLEAKEEEYGKVQAEYRELELNYTNLKTATTISLNGSDVKETKLRLSKLVREVDKCIALLNE